MIILKIVILTLVAVVLVGLLVIIITIIITVARTFWTTLKVHITQSADDHRESAIFFTASLT